MRRVALVPALASLGAMLLLAGTQDSVRGQTAEDSAHRTYKGVMVSDLDTSPRRLAAARVGVVRINAGKASPTRGYGDIGLYTARLRAWGIRPLPMLQQNLSLTDRQWKRAVRAFATNVRAVFLEIGNEPGPRAWPRYFHLVRLAAPIIHNHGKKVVLAGSENVDTNRYLTAAKATGDIFPRVDGVAIHPYAPTPYLVQQRIIEARRIVPWRLPFWITEVGWGTGPNQDKGYGGLDVTPRAQERHVGRLYFRLFRLGRLLNLASIGYFIWKDYGPGDRQGDEWFHHSGLLRIDGTRKPAYATYASRPRARVQG
jgi:hypothetical protein